MFTSKLLSRLWTVSFFTLNSCLLWLGTRLMLLTLHIVIWSVVRMKILIKCNFNNTLGHCVCVVALESNINYYTMLCIVLMYSILLSFTVICSNIKGIGGHNPLLKYKPPIGLDWGRLGWQCRHVQLTLINNFTTPCISTNCDTVWCSQRHISLCHVPPCATGMEIKHWF